MFGLDEAQGARQEEVDGEEVDEEAQPLTGYRDHRSGGNVSET